MVLVKESGEPRSNWKLGKIISLDDREAVASVQCKNSVLTTSIKLSLSLRNVIRRDIRDISKVLFGSSVGSVKNTNNFQYFQLSTAYINNCGNISSGVIMKTPIIFG